MTPNKQGQDEKGYDLHVIAKSLTHNKRIQLFEYIRITKDKAIKQEHERMIEQFEDIIDGKIVQFAELDEFRWDDLKSEIKLELRKLKQEKEDGK